MLTAAVIGVAKGRVTISTDLDNQYTRLVGLSAQEAAEELKKDGYTFGRETGEDAFGEKLQVFFKKVEEPS